MRLIRNFAFTPGKLNNIGITLSNDFKVIMKDEMKGEKHTFLSFELTYLRYPTLKC